ncbi:MAG: fibronectin type III domain-containing protein [Vicinamibacterales bacterium]
MRFAAFVTAVLSSVVLVSAPARAQAPQAQPLVQAGNLVYLGKFSLPLDDGTGGATANAFTYGGFALGIGPDGQSLYFGCHDQGSRLARVTIPAIGGVARVVEPCAAVPNLAGVNPGDVNGIKLGGSLSWNGRLVVTGYAYYDASYSAVASHFIGSNVTSLAGPYRVGTDMPGMVAGYMGVVPQEWRALLGGPALTGQCCISIISRTSYGPSVSVFDPDQLGAGAVSSRMLVGYPDAHQTLGGYYQSGPYFNAATMMAGVAFPAGTRSVLFFGRHGTTHCYGSGTSNPALNGQPDGQGGTWCYDPTNSYKGPHGYPYHHQVWAYDANDLLQVKAGLKNPWDLMPYATWALPDIDGGNGTATVRSATYDQATRRWYITTDSGGATPEVHVYEVTSAVLQPTRLGPQRFALATSNGTWTFSWLPPSEPGWTSYQLEGGTAPGLSDIGAIALAPNATSFSMPAAGGSFFVRVKAMYPDGGHARSAELLVSGSGGGGGGAGATPAPSAVRATASGSSLVITWAGATGASVSDVVLDAGTAAGRSDIASGVSIGTSGTFVAPNVPAGHYYVRLRAVGATGLSVTSNEADAVVGGAGGGSADAPGTPDGFRATASGSTVTLTWFAPEDGPAPTSYLLEAGTRSGAADLVAGFALPASLRVTLPGVPPGVYYLRLRAVNGGTVGAAGGEVRLVVTP